jgi:flagellar motor switch protein FliG
MNRELTSREKAAILMIMLGKDHAAQIYKHLNEDEVEQLTLSITSTRHVDPGVKEAVLNEFLEICMAQEFISEGGINYASEVLEQAFGEKKANDLITRLSTSLRVRPFDFIRRADSTQISNFIQNEHPQTIALVLSYLDPQQAAAMLSSLPLEKQTSVIARIANMSVSAPEYIKEVERILEKNMASVNQGQQAFVGGIDSLVKILNSVDRGTEKSLLEYLEQSDPKLTEEINNRMFVFEDVTKLDNRAIQTVLKEIDNNDLAVALKGATKEVTKVIFNNISKRLQETIKEEIEFLGPVRIRDVEEAQQKIVNVIRRLDETGEIIILRKQEDQLIV